MAAQGGEHVVDAPFVELLAPFPGPLFADFAAVSPDGFGDLEEMALGVEDVDDPDGVGDVLVGEVPDPWRAVAEHDATLRLVETTSLGLAQGTLGEGCGLGIGLAGGDGFDGGVAGGGAGVAYGTAVVVDGLRRPYDGEFGLAGLGGAVGLLARAAPRHRSCVPARPCRRGPEVEGGGIAGLGFDDMHFVVGDRASERLGVALHRPGGDGEASQFAQQGAGAVEAGSGRGDADHA